MTPDNNFVFEKGTLFVAPGGGGAPTPLLPGAANQALFANPSAPLGVEWGTGSAMGNVVGPVSSTAHHLAAFADTTGELLEDSGILTANVALGAGSSTMGHLMSFASTDGKTIADSGIIAANVALGVSSAVSANFAAFNGTGGKQLEDSGFSQNSFIQVIRTTAVDMTSVASYTLFTPATAFVITQIVAYAVTLTGTITEAVFNIGWTSSAFNDVLATVSSTNALTGEVNKLIPNNSLFKVVPASTALKINVTTADTTASVDSQRFDIIGYYV